MRQILHVDMDQFYAAVEILDNPLLKDKPVIVGADPKQGRGRGVVSTASYQARALGIKSGQPISHAYKLCPHGYFVPVRMQRYIQVSGQIHSVFKKYTPLVEGISLDEAFLDISDSEILFGKAERIALAVKKDIFDLTGLKASVGLACNKLCAKIASDLKKPDSLVIVPVGSEADFLAPLPIKKMWGIGPKTEALLLQKGFSTLGQLAQADSVILRKLLGINGPRLILMARGQDQRPVEPLIEAKSMGREITYEQDTADLNNLKTTLAWLSEDLAGRLRRNRQKCAGLILKTRWHNFETVTRRIKLSQTSDHGPDLYKKSVVILQKIMTGSSLKIRLLGLYAVELVDSGKLKGQLDFFEKTDHRQNKLDQAVDLLNQRYGKKIMLRANQLGTSARGSITGFSPKEQ
jgi:DNA polymerase IV